ncbi:hypothetical protein BDK51DRAFT_44672 [Blyttiomyces helicus]|uniref:Uncharacterized protein n=1 Tax=Blyttiomyces helicus TaxID=388810 RepID=A0A4P9VU73_9FUNG|nr:hypothetical protein BDK51DRAFT_44672 [Blyttiomyces helicus]|eukprot:RKO83121.1 hypothetical protein BDK51DRAFT_44672 [Blyttiomyces helicus]
MTEDETPSTHDSMKPAGTSAQEGYEPRGRWHRLAAPFAGALQFPSSKDAKPNSLTQIRSPHRGRPRYLYKSLLRDKHSLLTRHCITQRIVTPPVFIEKKTERMQGFGVIVGVAMLGFVAQAQGSAYFPEVPIAVEDSPIGILPPDVDGKQIGREGKFVEGSFWKDWRSDLSFGSRHHRMLVPRGDTRHDAHSSPDENPPAKGRAAGGYGSRRPDRALIVIAGDDGGADEDQDQEEIEDDEDQVPVRDDDDDDGKGDADHDDSVVNDIDNDQCNRADDAHARGCLVNTLADHAEPCDHNARIRTKHPHDRARPVNTLAGQAAHHRKSDTVNVPRPESKADGPPPPPFATMGPMAGILPVGAAGAVAPRVGWIAAVGVACVGWIAG